MHLLLAKPGANVDAAEAVDLGQTPAEVVFLTAADSEIALLARARAAMGDAAPTLRAANWLKLRHNASVDAYVERMLGGAKLVVARLLGGRAYWPYGVDQIAAACQRRDIALALLPGDDKPDDELAALSTLAVPARTRLWRMLAEGGPENARRFLACAAALTGRDAQVEEPLVLPKAGLHHSVDRGRPRAGIVFYRALYQAGDLAVVDALVEALDARGLDARAVYVSSLKDAAAASFLATAFAAGDIEVAINLTSFAVGDGDPLAGLDCPVLQATIGAESEEIWRGGTRGLAPRDIAMGVALPELDGRIFTRAIGFKALARRDDAIEADVMASAPVASRIDFVADLAAAWARLRRTRANERRVALVLANYPNRDGRIANGVGLDTPASVIAILEALRAAGYGVGDVPADGDALMRAIVAGPTNAAVRREGGESLSLADYMLFLGELPAATRAALQARWGAPEDDPWFEPGDLDCGRFRLPVLGLGRVIVAVQPARGYNIDPVASYHAPDLVPPHGYLAFHCWLRTRFDAHAVVHVGKHGNLEWLPGKSIALDATCWPEAALGPLPNLYPFIVNDPGEGTQAKRRAAAVIVDHLTPPLARAGAHGEGAALERLIDEYYEASQQDPRRCKPLAREILDLARSSGLDRDCAIAPHATLDEALVRLDSWLCELKDRQIRDGLHVYGRTPAGAPRASLLAAIARSPRGAGESQVSLLRALARDLGLATDPLTSATGAPWPEPLPAALGAAPARLLAGDVVERLDALALALIDGTRAAEPGWTRTHAVLRWVAGALAPAIDTCGRDEIAGLLRGLAGRRVAPGPSGAPTRGRPDVLPTGRNFFSVDTRAVPTPASWTLGWAAAEALLERHLQEHGDHLRVAALTAWGTSNMRTGGDDVAQVLALMGVRPTWDEASRRVTGFEILPLSLLGRPRVDVTLRVSGLFRDAFANLIELVDRAVRDVAALDEPPDMNPLAARARAEGGTARVFGPKPGAYGAGLQALIDEGGWTRRDDLGAAYVAWSGWAYAGGEGREARGELESRLSRVEAVLQNQDNREHDILDSDDYYQFQGGLSAAVERAQGRSPRIYHVDTSLPERPRALTLAEEIAAVVRSRAINPRWIEGCKRHGYKGAFEIAATVDYLFAYAATTDAVQHHHFDALYDAYLADEETRAFLEAANPAALREIATRLLEAQHRALWRPRLNSTRSLLRRLQEGQFTAEDTESAEDRREVPRD